MSVHATHARQDNENMQAHFDARLDRIEGMLMQHSMRLNRIENLKSGK